MVVEELDTLRRMLRRWKVEADRFKKRVEYKGYEPPMGKSHIWANLFGVLEMLDDALEDWD